MGKQGYLTIILDSDSGAVVFAGDGRAVKRWIEMARNSGIGTLLKFSKALAKHLEGINNKIKTMQRKAYGYRDMDSNPRLLVNSHS